MYQKPNVPRSIGGVLDDSLQLYRASFKSCVLPALLVSVIGAAFSVFVFASMAPLLSPNLIGDPTARFSSMFGNFGIAYLVMVIVSVIFYGMLVVNVTAASRGEIPTFGSSIAKALRRAPLVIVGSIAFAIILGVGFILLIIPGIYFWIRLQLFMIPLIDEREGPFTSLGTSWRLVGGHWWRTLVIISVMFVLLVVLQIILTTIGAAIAAFSGVGTSAASTPAMLVGRVQVVTTVVGAFVRIFTAPLVVAVLVATYQDLKLRLGGADLEARLGALPKA